MYKRQAHEQLDDAGNRRREALADALERVSIDKQKRQQKIKRAVDDQVGPRQLHNFLLAISHENTDERPAGQDDKHP